MSVTISMPQLGETVTEGTILAWVKEVGEYVAEDDILVEISTDKVDTEIPSPAHGVLTEILIAAGTTIDVGTPICVLSDESQESGPESQESRVKSQDEEEPAPAAVISEPVADASEGRERRGIISPIVRKLARDNGIDLSTVEGTGPDGTIKREDLETSGGSAAVPMTRTGASILQQARGDVEFRFFGAYRLTVATRPCSTSPSDTRVSTTQAQNCRCAHSSTTRTCRAR